jgi:hypothetical protein
MNKSLSEIVEQRLREAQAKKTFKDSEIRVGGSRKEKAMLNKLSQFTLDDLNFNFADFEEATVIPFIVKSKVFPAFNIQDQKEIGCTSGAAFYKSKIREAFPAKPLYLSRPALKTYVGFGGLFYGKILAAPTLNRVMEEVGKISSKCDYYLPKFVFGDNMSTITEAVEILISENEIDFDLRKEFVDFDDLYQYYLEAGPKIGALSNKAKLLNEYFLFNLATAFMPDFLASLTRYEKSRLPEAPNKYFLSYFFKSRFGNIIDVLYSETTYNIMTMAYSESAAKAIFQANEYDQLTEEQAQILIQKAINPLLDRKAKYEKEYALAAAAKDVYEFDDLIQSEQIKDYLLHLMFDKSKKSGARKSLRNLYNITQRQTNFAKLDNLEDKKYYISRYLVTLEMWIKSVNDQIEKIRDKFKPRSEDWSWAEKEAPTGGQSTKPKKQAIHSKEVLTHIERKGGLLIDKNRLSNIEAINDYLSITFGFRAFEYGASLPDREAKEILFHFLGAMSDISEILNLDFATLNRRCGLSMGFGSRGRGRAKAHYEPLARIINLTRSNGDGSVAHELAHFIDNQVPRLDHSDTYNYLQYATENNDINPSNKHHRPGNVSNYNVASVFRDIMRFIVSGTVGILPTNNKAYIDYEADASRVAEGTIYKIGDNILFGIRAAGIGLEKLVDFIDSTPEYSRYLPSYEQTPKANFFLYDYIISKLGVDKYTFKIKSDRSVYFADSANVGGDYWTTNTELFARAFETYVFDKLKNADRYNNFLTSGEFEDEAAIGRPYPRGEQRKTLYYMFDKLIEVIKQAYAIPDFQPFTEEKNIYFNEIINISENKPEKHKKDFELKMATLLALLKAEKPEMGVGGDLEKEMTTKGEGILLFWELGKLAAKHDYNETYLTLLNQFFAVPNVPEILKQMRLIYSSVIRNAGLEAYGNTMMAAAGYKMIELFEEMTSENQTETLNKVSILQRVIDVCILVRNNEEINQKEAGSTYRGYWWRVIAKTYFAKREADFKKSTQKTWEIIHAESKFAESVIFDEKYTDDNAHEGHDLDFCNELESEYDTFLKAKKHGFDKIAQIDEYGRAKYPLKEIMKEEFKLKALEASIEISQLPNGEYVNGFRLGDSTSGSFSGPSINNRPFATIQEAIKDFYVGTRHYFRGNFPYAPAVYSTLKALYKMIHERLNISPADIEEQTVLDNEKLAKLSGKSEKPQTVVNVIPKGSTPFDRQAQKYIMSYLDLRAQKKAFKSYLNFMKKNFSSLDYDIYTIVDLNIKELYHFKSIKDLYQGALNLDLENFDIVRETRKGEYHYFGLCYRKSF